MNEDASRRTNKGGPPAREGLRPSLVAGVSILAVVLIVGAVLVQRRANEEQPLNVTEAASPPASMAESIRPGKRVTQPRSVEAASENPPTVVEPKTVVRHTNTVASASATTRQASPYARSLIGNLVNLDPRRGPLTPEQAQYWKGEFDKLVKSGDDGAAAIREFLNSNVDLKLATLEGGDQLGVASLRDAMFDALRQIGGAEAVAVAAEAMQTTGSPKEIARLARDLEELSPGQYQEAALAAARLGLVRAAQNTTAVDTSPLFEVFQRFGDANAIADLEQATTKWNYYGPLVLASLADGAGIPSLTRIAQNADGKFTGSSRFAWQLLAELAPQYPDAAKGLSENIANNKIPAAAWPGIVAALGGERMFYGEGWLNTMPTPPDGTSRKNYFIVLNQQSYRSFNLAPGWAPEQLQRQLQLIDQLRLANPAAAGQLEEARKALGVKPAP